MVIVQHANHGAHHGAQSPLLLPGGPPLPPHSHYPSANGLAAGGSKGLPLAPPGPGPRPPNSSTPINAALAANLATHLMPDNVPSPSSTISYNNNQQLAHHYHSLNSNYTVHSGKSGTPGPHPPVMRPTVRSPYSHGNSVNPNGHPNQNCLDAPPHQSSNQVRGNESSDKVPSNGTHPNPNQPLGSNGMGGAATTATAQGGDMAFEFLPFCDQLFNIISLLIYLLSVIFNVIYILFMYRDTSDGPVPSSSLADHHRRTHVDDNDEDYEDSQGGKISPVWFSSSLTIIIFSLAMTQIMSFGWFAQRMNEQHSSQERKKRKDKAGGPADHHGHELESSLSSAESRSDTSDDNLYTTSSYVVLLIHMFQCGVIWRYLKLFIPVDLSVVKDEVRDLCILRMVHGFCQAGPMLLIQVYLIWQKSASEEVSELSVTASLLSLINLCWALAGFNKNIRRKHIHKLIFTWLGVIFQFLWRLGTVSSRVIALTVFASAYSRWIFLIMFLHWFAMLLWLLSPKVLFRGESISLNRRVAYSSLIAWIYMFCYVNLTSNSRKKMQFYYAIIFCENCLLLFVSLKFSGVHPWFQELALTGVFGCFVLGIFFMTVYYHLFHIRHIQGRLRVADLAEATRSRQGGGGISGGEQLNRFATYGRNGAPGLGVVGANGRLGSGTAGAAPGQMNIIPMAHRVSNGVPGVFNCRLNPALKRKKKKPSSFVPPPPPAAVIHPNPRQTPSSPTSNVQLPISQKTANNSQSSQIPNATTVSTPANGANTVNAMGKPVLASKMNSAVEFWKNEVGSGANNWAAGRQLSAPAVSHLSAKHPFSSSITSSPITLAEESAATAVAGPEAQQQASGTVKDPAAQSPPQIYAPPPPHRFVPNAANQNAQQQQPYPFWSTGHILSGHNAGGATTTTRLINMQRRTHQMAYGMRDLPQAARMRPMSCTVAERSGRYIPTGVVGPSVAEPNQQHQEANQRIAQQSSTLHFPPSHHRQPFNQSYHHALTANQHVSGGSTMALKMAGRHPMMEGSMQHPQHHQHHTMTLQGGMRSAVAAIQQQQIPAQGNRPGVVYQHHPLYRKMKQRSYTPEVLMAPHHMDQSRVYYDPHQHQHQHHHQALIYGSRGGSELPIPPMKPLHMTSTAHTQGGVETGNGISNVTESGGGVGASTCTSAPNDTQGGSAAAPLSQPQNAF